jgi:cobalt-precorrin 5A hydrolase/precorrin-3B C17-methyltransferase
VLAPLLKDKTTEPGVVCVDEAGRYAVALVGGHEGGANTLADRVAAAIGAQPVITTASESRAAQVRRPASLVLGIGASRGATADEILALVDSALADESLSGQDVAGVATVDAKADEAGLLDAAARRGWPIAFFSAAELAAVPVPNPSEAVQAAVGTPSVAEAAALLAAGPNATLSPKRKSARATVAIARRVPRGRLAIIGLGPGARDLLTPRAVAELQRASVVVGLDQYVDQVRDLIGPGSTVLATGLGDEEARARSAVGEAAKGQAVALIGSGDAGVYAMASPALDYAGADIDVVVVPGVTALLAAAADIGGAPLGHDHCAISLSDLHTPWEVIERRVRAAADGDFVVGFYNPRSAKREWQLPKALAILAEQRPGTTPVAVVTNATRPSATAVQTTLAELDVELVGMYSLVLVGSSQSRYVAGRFVTPRGYTWAG